MTTYRYDRAARPWPQYLTRVEPLRPDRLVPNAKLSIPGHSSGVRLSADLINTPEGHGSTVTRPISCSSCHLDRRHFHAVFGVPVGSTLASVELHVSAFSGGATVQL